MRHRIRWVLVGGIGVAIGIGGGCGGELPVEEGIDVRGGDAAPGGLDCRLEHWGPETIVFDPGARDPGSDGADASPEVAQDAGTTDPGGPDGSGCPGAFGCPCHVDEDCPRGWTCEPTDGSGASGVTHACVDPFARLCQPCLEDSECVPPQGTAGRRHACIHFGRDGSYCGIECTTDSDCPEDYSCREAPDLAPAASQCMPRYGACACTERFRLEGHTTRCSVTNAHGTCLAMRTCDRPCPAATPAPETCNGLDDDCDGRTDEDTLAECFPTVCDPVLGACADRCRDRRDCPAGSGCVDRFCRRLPGASCERDAQCASGFCADGVCCRSRCDGVCEDCALPGRAGHCDPVPPLLDPDEECPAMGASTCASIGFCSGNRTCALHPAGTPCASPICIDGSTLALADRCDGAGHCRDGGTAQCDPTTCDPSEGSCRLACVADPDCLAGHVCVDGRCARSNGGPCSADGECASGFCSDGVCCEAPCDGTCEACDLPGRAGICDPVPDGRDPDGECPLESYVTCRSTGGCSGARSCRLHPAGTACATPSCATPVLANLPDSCDGKGTCVEGGTRDCRPFTCNPQTGRCGTACDATSGCAPGYACRVSTGDCLKPDGHSCSAASECLGGACCAGTCRNLDSDRNHCGACGNSCRNEHGTTSCRAGTCRPTCEAGWGDCDNSRSSGCETSLRTLTDCTGCGTSCTRADGIASCDTGTCVLAECSPDHASCDGVESNGCEVDLASTSNSCGSAEWIGSHCGDLACGTLCPAATWSSLALRSGRAGRWFRGGVGECSSCCAGMALQVTLTVPAGVDYDLYVYGSCGSLVASSLLGPGSTDQVTLRQADDCLSGDSGFDYWVEVRHHSGASCEPWILGFDGTSCS